uniref:Uncharacterized protein n=1 Tax=Opuntia streptacantha TaxID=393608 RepID=A0A7C9CQE9_OPUST
MTYLTRSGSWQAGHFRLLPASANTILIHTDQRCALEWIFEVLLIASQASVLLGLTNYDLLLRELELFLMEFHSSFCHFFQHGLLVCLKLFQNIFALLQNRSNRFQLWI